MNRLVINGKIKKGKHYINELISSQYNLLNKVENGDHDRNDIL